MKMETETKANLIILFVVAGLIILSFVIISHISSSDTDILPNEWWTKVFCLEENGEYQERFFLDVCIINGEVYEAQFVEVEVTSRVHQEYKPIKEKSWQLVKR